MWRLSLYYGIVLIFTYPDLEGVTWLRHILPIFLLDYHKLLNRDFKYIYTALIFIVLHSILFSIDKINSISFTFQFFFTLIFIKSFYIQEKFDISTFFNQIWNTLFVLITISFIGAYILDIPNFKDVPYTSINVKYQVAGLFSTATNFGIVLNYFVFVSIIKYNNSRYKKYLMALIIFFVGIFLIFNSSRSSMIIFLFLCIFLLHQKNLFFFKYTYLLYFLAFLYISPQLIESISQIVKIADIQNFGILGSRYIPFYETIEAINKANLFGVGYANEIQFKDQNLRYNYTGLHAHNTYLTLFLEFKLFFTIFFLFFISKIKKYTSLYLRSNSFNERLIIFYFLLLVTITANFENTFNFVSSPSFFIIITLYFYIENNVYKKNSHIYRC